MTSADPQKIPPARNSGSLGHGGNVNGIVGSFFSGLSLLGWILMSCLMVSYDSPNAKPQPTPGNPQAAGNNVAYEELVHDTGAFVNNAFLTFIGGAVSAAFLLVGVIVSGIGLSHPAKAPAAIGLSLGLAALICGLLFISWRWAIWFT